ncbi:hypothetical protein QE152_g34147 [Popillia japonica]|uniref:Uncharacterized protein n=1 Tax=Popillia japonica TaxID=7064 RepID=A0AAW1IUF0_POPJA
MGLITFSSNKGLLAKKASDRRAASIFGKAYEYEEVLRYVYFLRQFVDTYDDDRPPVFSARLMSMKRYLGMYTFFDNLLILTTMIFELILKFLRFSDPNAADRAYPLNRLAMFFSHLRENTLVLLDIGKLCAVDECLMFSRVDFTSNSI